MLARLLALLALAIPAAAAAQYEDDVPLQRHAAYLELGGNASRYSLNYERMLAEHHRLRFGLGIWTGGETMAISETELMLPIMYNVLIGGGPHYLELGAGVLLGAINRDEANTTVNGTFWSGTGTIGYRHQLPVIQWVFRVGFTPIIGFGDRDIAYPRSGFVPRIGASVGWAFN